MQNGRNLFLQLCHFLIRNLQPRELRECAYVDTGACHRLIIRINSASVSTATPSSLALSSFEPASSPAMTAVVFLDTEPDTLPPKARMRSAASSRDMDFRLPVRT